MHYSLPTTHCPRVAAVCCTWDRPELLGRMIGCFLAQDYPADRRELLILDDAGQYGDRQGDRWRIISLPHRFATLGAKRNAAVSLLDLDVEIVCVWDDDDAYQPWATAAVVAALGPSDCWSCAWTRPSLVFEQQAGKLLTFDTRERQAENPAYHSGWAYRRAAFDDVGGYRLDSSNGEDGALVDRLAAVFGPSGDTISSAFPRPFLVYSRKGSPSAHLSGLGRGNDGYRKLGLRPVPPWPGELPIRYPAEILDLPVDPEIRPRPW